MKVSLCPNCGSVQFDESAGRCQCIYCGAEFEIDDRVTPDNIIPDNVIYCYCPDPDKPGRFIEIARIVQ